MEKWLETLCTLDGASGDEGSVRDYILSQIEGFCEVRIDALGNIIAKKKGKKTPKNRIMLDAHMDEVGVIAKYVTDDGFIKFSTVGGINTECLLAQRVRFGSVRGVIGIKPTHLLSKDEQKKLPDADGLYIDIGAKDKAEALSLISLGDFGVFDSEYIKSGDIICSKAIDDRAGCAMLIKLLRSDAEYDFYATFTVQEEVGTRGAGCAAFSVEPDYCICLESTTASDIAGVDGENRVCLLGGGPVLSFMDRSTVYDREMFKTATECGVKWQPKTAVAGGNNGGAIQRSGRGVRTLAISIPCRYLHSASCVASLSDMENAYNLCVAMLSRLGDRE